MSDTDMMRIHTEVPRKIWHDFSILSVIYETTKKELLQYVLEEYINREKEEGNL